MNVGGLVYGSITVGALLAAETRVKTGYPEVVGSVALALVAYWLAHGYAELLGRRLQEATLVTPGALGRALLRTAPVLAGGAIPLVVVLMWWAAGGGVVDAAIAAVWVDVAVIVAIELTAALRARLTPRETLAQTAVGATLGGLLIALRLVLNH